MKTKNHRDYGLTDEAFHELVDFYRELFRLDENLDGRRLRRNRQTLLVVLKNLLEQLKLQKRNEILRQLEGLEKL